MSALDRAFETARARQGRILAPEIDDPRMADAARRIEAEGLAEIITLKAARPAEEYVEHILAVRPTTRPAIAARLLAKPMVRAAAMVAAGEADALIAGAATPTRRVIEAAALSIGPAGEGAVPSSFFLMIFPDGREFIFADCAVNLAPDAATLAAIGRAACEAGALLLGTARTALLSFSTGASGAGPTVEVVREAAALLSDLDSPLNGPIQADAALNPVIAAAKGVSGGASNVLIFPSLDAGNIAYKLAQELAGAQAVGPFLQGFRRPVCDLSRGAGVDDIVAAAAVTMALA
ncbi:phosphate acetyltransferase [Pikeienuella piscinae]|uniref:Phosphate acetyltransferase n=1 Tax=Pikeienuella piscinae TaxID=2748098 RepID=A0A7M3T7I4_9RHOB|nr:phosphate acetyltransferase [Pikeienuella piscinae]